MKLADYLDLRDLVADHGGEENFRFWFPLDILEYWPLGIRTTSSLNDKVLVECKLDMTEDDFYRLSHGYKVRIVPANDMFKDVLASHRMYQSDLLACIRSGDYCWIKEPGDKVEFIEWEEPLSELAVVRRNAQVIMKG